MRGFDVGGSHKSQQSGYESFGIRNQNRVVTEGVDTTEGTGGAGIYQDFFAHEEVSVSAAGGDVTMMTPGSAVFSTIKSGGNEFKSFNNLTWEDGSFVGDNIDATTAKRGFTGQPNLIFYEGHTDLGGPIKRDKVWFYVAYNHFKIDKAISGVAPRVLATSASSTTSRRRAPTRRRRRTRSSATTSGRGSEAAPRPLEHHARDVDPRAGQRRRGCTTPSGSASGRTASSRT